jgi:hypothetical protein
MDITKEIGTIKEVVLQQQQAIAELHSLLAESLRSQQSQGVSDPLLTAGEVLARLGLKRDDKAWRKIRETLIREYGFNQVNGAGRRIRESELKKFLNEKFAKRINSIVG